MGWLQLKEVGSVVRQHSTRLAFEDGGETDYRWRTVGVVLEERRPGEKGPHRCYRDGSDVQ
jgi:hypothetical protein